MKPARSREPLLTEIDTLALVDALKLPTPREPEPLVRAQHRRAEDLVHVHSYDNRPVYVSSGTSARDINAIVADLYRQDRKYSQ